MPAPSGIRLRESCQACALSKIKCSKDKPSCNRCSERGTTCQYLVTQKTGRKVRRRSISNRPETCGRLPAQATTSSLPPVLPSTLASIGDASNFDFPMLESHFDSLDPSISSSTPHDYLTMLLRPGDSSISSPTEPFEHLFNSSEVVDPILTVSTTGSNTPKLILEEFDYSQNLAPPMQTEGTRMALQLMEQLCSREDSPPSTILTPPEVDLQTNTIIDECKIVAENVTAMMKCAGSDDGYCLVVVCLLISKVLNGYAKVAHAFTSREREGQRRPGSSSLSSTYARPTEDCRIYPVTSPDRDPKALPHLLDHLYSVRSVLDHVGAKIQACPNRDWFFGSGHHNSTGHDPILPAFPFSAAILNQLHQDLQRHLNAISLQVLNELKSFWTQ